MNTATTRNSALADWISVLLAAERSADAMNTEINEQFQLLDAHDNECTETSVPADVHAAINTKLTGLTEKVVAVRQSVEEADADLLSVCSDLSSWCRCVANLRERLSNLAPA